MDKQQTIKLLEFYRHIDDEIQLKREMFESELDTSAEKQRGVVKYAKAKKPEKRSSPEVIYRDEGENYAQGNC